MTDWRTDWENAQELMTYALLSDNEHLRLEAAKMIVAASKLSIEDVSPEQKQRIKDKLDELGWKPMETKHD